jgi:hypothetical protein
LTQNRGTGSGGRRDGHSHSHASGRGGRVGPTAVVFGSGPAASAVQTVAIRPAITIPGRSNWPPPWEKSAANEPTISAPTVIEDRARATASWTSGGPLARLEYAG